jgi:hypothetical protein
MRVATPQPDYLEFEGRPHLHMAAADWQEVAAAIDNWLDGVLDAPITETEQTHAYQNHSLFSRVRRSDGRSNEKRRCGGCRVCRALPSCPQAAHER